MTSDYLPTQFARKMSASHSIEKPAHTNTFVHKLYNMVIDSYFQHLISWSYSGSSFIVCNILEFSKEVLPKHFKHNNFSSFVRQLNMYGFHKVNKSPRGHRTSAENQIWEFSHARFLRNRPDLLDEIKRKTLEETKTNDVQNNMAFIQASQSDLVEQMQNLYENFTQVVKEMHEMKQVQEQQAQMIKAMTNYLEQQQHEHETKHKPPSIFVTSPQPLLNEMLHRSSLSVQTQDLTDNRLGFPNPPSPSPSMLISDDELDAASSLYSPNSPHTPRHAHYYSQSLDPLSHQ